MRWAIVKFRTVKCSLDAAKRGFFTGHLTAFSKKIGHIAFEEVILYNWSTKCIPILYGLEVFPIRQSQLRSLDMIIRSFPNQ